MLHEEILTPETLALLKTLMFFTPEMLAKIDKSVEEAKEGKLKTFATKKELHTYLDSL